MATIRKRPRMYGALGVLLYLLIGFTTSDLQSLEISETGLARCPASLGTAGNAPVQKTDRGRDRSGKLGSDGRIGPMTTGEAFTVLQGNLWMLPARPLLLPYAFSTDRGDRLERLVRTVQACRPSVVLLQEVFETSMVELLARHLPEYRVMASGATDLTGTLNASGLVTLSRLPVRHHAFHPFGPLPPGAKAIEELAQKGFLSVELEGPDFRGTLLNLHLYASRDPDEAGVTHGQLDQVVAFVEAEAAAGRTVLVGGDFNVPEAELADLLPDGWTLSVHGPTYDPGLNPYTVRGSNNTPGNHRDRRERMGARTIDFLVTPAGTPARVRSEVLDTLLLSDHQFLHHTVHLAVDPTDG